jgi:hypothetical protein
LLYSALGFDSRAALAAYFQGQAFAGWLHAPEHRLDLRQALQDLDPGIEAEARERADAVVAHRFDLLGSGPVALGREIDWLCDFKTGARWAPQFYRTIDYINWGRPSDVKVPWELSRSYHLTDLARAYLLTDDDAYVNECAAQMCSWVEANPIGMTVNWACTMDVAIRAINWIWALSVIAPNVPQGVLEMAIASLWSHAHFIARNLEVGDVNGNHYLADAAGLVALGALFRHTAQGQRWLRRGRAIMVSEMPRQVASDGVQHEMSAPYHRLVTELFLTAFLVLRQNRLPAPRWCWVRLELMMRFIASYTRPDGSTPVWGDADDGRVQRFGLSNINDHRHLLSTGAVLTRRVDLRSAVSTVHEDTLWLLGSSSVGEFRSLPASPIRRQLLAFPESGVAIDRRSRTHLFFDAGPVGLQGRGGHGHNDALHCELWFDGPLFVDPGAYVYTADPEARNRFRSSRAHNSPLLNGEEIAPMGDIRNLWFIEDGARATLTSARLEDGVSVIVGQHHGFERFHRGCIVRRCVRVDESAITIQDSVSRIGQPWITRFVLAPDLTVKTDGMAAVVAGRVDPYQVEVTGAQRLTRGAAEVSPSYGVRVRAEALEVSSDGGVVTVRVTHDSPELLQRRSHASQRHAPQ